jgi:threonine dehydrogenase-like Zn-dependent dehydrogenase
VIAIHDGILVGAELPEGSAAVVDREWLPADGSSRSVPALVVADLDEGARALAGIAHYAVAAAPGPTVEVTGSGLVAAEARRELGERLAPTGSQEPAAIVETTGDPATVIDATERVQDLGTVVLAGEPRGRTYRIDLYPDVHVRGLRLVARGRHAQTQAGPAPADRDGLQVLRRGEALDPSARWFCVVQEDA